ncbi:DNA-binding response regulator (plasmid) [Rhizobium jaguaris]|uniref:DNA-binding response regulator n=2 Tax=Rhizobium jaguaris TaxID=1312183 RepID=A0A387G1M6_9HYPH|nr:response regulator [Rhizobium jaguaris]AYG63727.1 DNA-binding response regulator [Rhizobium jaguaris]
MQPTSSGAPIVLIVDDDELVLKSVDGLVRSAGYRSALYPSAVELLSKPLPEGVRCLVADVRLPLVSGLDLQAELAKRGERVPILFITGHGDIPMSVRAMKAGAVDFLSKPFRDQDILDAIACALAEDIRLKELEGELESLRARYESLTSREREVLQMVSSGLLNKQVACELGLSEITVKLHRGSAMRKMGALTLAQVVRMMEAIERGTLQGHTPV